MKASFILVLLHCLCRTEAKWGLTEYREDRSKWMIGTMRQHQGHRQSSEEAKISFLAGSCLILTVLNRITDVPLAVKMSAVPTFALTTKILYPRTFVVANPAMDVILISLMRSDSVPWPYKLFWLGFYQLCGRPPHRWGTAVVSASLIMSNQATGGVDFHSPPWQAKLGVNLVFTSLSLLLDGYFASFPAGALTTVLLLEEDVPIAFRIGSALLHMVLGILSFLFADKVR